MLIVHYHTNDQKKKRFLDDLGVEMLTGTMLKTSRGYELFLKESLDLNLNLKYKEFNATLSVFSLTRMYDADFTARGG